MTACRLLRPRRAPSPGPGLLLVLCASILMPGQADAQEGLGRLFHTPEQRRQLDELRRLGAPRPGLETSPALRLDGVVRHPDGRVTVWVNGRPAGAGRAIAGQAPDQARITTETGKSVPLRVGEALPADGSPTQGLLGGGVARPDATTR